MPEAYRCVPKLLRGDRWRPWTLRRGSWEQTVCPHETGDRSDRECRRLRRWRHGGSETLSLPGFPNPKDRNAPLQEGERCHKRWCEETPLAPEWNDRHDFQPQNARSRKAGTQPAGGRQVRDQKYRPGQKCDPDSLRWMPG